MKEQPTETCNIWRQEYGEEAASNVRVFSDIKLFSEGRAGIEDELTGLPVTKKADKNATYVRKHRC